MVAVYAPEDRSDEAYERQLQRELDAFTEGRRVGRLGLGAGLCPQDMSREEQAEWLRGFNEGAADYITNRRAA